MRIGAGRDEDTTVLVTLLLASVPTQIPRTDRPAREECHKNHNWLKNPAPSHTYYTLEETYDVKSKKCDTIGINLGAAVGGGNPPHRPPPGRGAPRGHTIAKATWSGRSACLIRQRHAGGTISAPRCA